MWKSGLCRGFFPTVLPLSDTRLSYKIAQRFISIGRRTDSVNVKWFYKLVHLRRINSVPQPAHDQNPNKNQDWNHRRRACIQQVHSSEKPPPVQPLNTNIFDTDTPQRDQTGTAPGLYWDSWDRTSRINCTSKSTMVLHTSGTSMRKWTQKPVE